MSLISQVLRTLGCENAELSVKWTEESCSTCWSPLWHCLKKRGLGSSESMNWVLTNWQDRSCLCSLVAILEENITVRYSRRRILILIILLEEKTRLLLRCLLPTVRAVAPPLSCSHFQKLKQRSQTGMGRTRKQRQYQGTLGQGLGCCGEQKRALAEQVKISDRLCCPSMSCILQQCPIHVVIRGTRKLNVWQTCRTGKKKIQTYILLASQDRHFYLLTPTH